MKSLFPFLKPYRLQLIIGPFFKLVEAILELLLPTMMAWMIRNGVRQQNPQYIWHMGGLMLLTAVVGVASALVCQYSASIASQGFGTKLRNALFSHINRLSIADQEKIGDSSLSNRIGSDVNTLQQGVAMLIRLVVRAPFLCIGGFIMAAFLNLKLSLILLAGIILFVLCIVLIMKKSVPLYTFVQKHLDRLILILRENLSGVRVIRAFAKTDHERNRFHKENREYRDASEEVGRIAALLNPLTLLILNVAIVAVLWCSGILTNNGQMAPEDIIAFINYLTLILQALLVVAMLVQLFIRVFASLGRVNEVLALQEEEQNPAQLPALVNEDQDAPLLCFSNVSFRYTEGAENALTNINFQLEQGKTLGIIGGTGSGKSTLAQLIPHFFDATEGSLAFSGRDVQQWPVEELRSQIGMALQKPLLFRGSVAENIRWGKQDATDDELLHAAQAAQADEFISAMAGGYNAHIERGGANLSGGQKQRLSIARALVRKPRLLILDDSASALDFQTDARLRSALVSYQKEYGMSVITISQRVASLRFADQILLLNGGNCVAQGTHEQLYESSEEYRQLCSIQGVSAQGGAR